MLDRLQVLFDREGEFRSWAYLPQIPAVGQTITLNENEEGVNQCYEVSHVDWQVARPPSGPGDPPRRYELVIVIIYLKPPS